MLLAQLAAPVALLVLGAGIGLVPTYLLERSKQKHLLSTRWDMPLFELCKEFASAARELVHLAMHLDRAADQADQRRELDLRHAELRGLYEQVRILGSSELQKAARRVIHHCYAVRAVAEGEQDAREEDYPGTTPAGRVKVSVNEFIIAARRQLGVTRPEDVPVDTVLQGEPWSSKWFTDTGKQERS
jgi:hypothetical protein